MTCDTTDSAMRSRQGKARVVMFAKIKGAGLEGCWAMALEALTLSLAAVELANVWICVTCFALTRLAAWDLDRQGPSVLVACTAVELIVRRSQAEACR